MNKELKNKDGSTDIVMITSNDNYSVNLNRNYKLVGYAGNKIHDNFKNSIFGSNIGIGSYGFVNVILLATGIAISLIVLMYFNFRI